MKESISRAFSYLLANKTALGVGREVDTSDFHVEVIDLLGNQRRGRDRRRLLRRRLLGPAQGGRRSRPARARRHEHPGQHQARALADRAAPGRDGQRRQARPDPDREQAQLPRRHPPTSSSTSTRSSTATCARPRSRRSGSTDAMDVTGPGVWRPYLGYRLTFGNDGSSVFEQRAVLQSLFQTFTEWTR